MPLSLLVVSMLFRSGDAPSHATVYRFFDHGVEHYVDRLEQVPNGIHADPIDLSDVPLNGETANALEDAAKAASKARPQAPSVAVVPKGQKPPPEDARIFLLWSAALTFAFIGLAVLALATKRRAPQISLALGVVRFVAGGLALMSWAATAYEYRGSHTWLAAHFPPLKALDQAAQTRAQVERQQEQLEKDADKAARGQ